MFLPRLGFIATLFLSILQPNFDRVPPPTPQVEPSATVVREMGLMKPDVMELQAQMKHRGTMPPEYWRDVHDCETRNWKDKGNYGGGLGIYIKTWKGYGGFEFARHPSRATPFEQMIVANRIAVLGYQTKNDFLTLDDRLNNRPFFRPASGFNGWGCIKHNRYLHPQNWRNKHRADWRHSKKNVLFPYG